MDYAAAMHIVDLLVTQDGVISRQQALECGATSADCRRKLARREWVAVYPGVYVNHTGPLTWQQRAWCAILDAQPAALSHASALPATGVRPPTAPVHIVVDRHRRATGHPGVVVHYRSSTETSVLWHTLLPRSRVEELKPSAPG